MTPEAAQQMIDAHAAQLGEHFESVQILVSFPFERGTLPVYAGRGNFFARKGMADDFIKRDPAEQIAVAITKQSE